MNQFNLGNFINRFINSSLLNSQGGSNRAQIRPETPFQTNQEAIAENMLLRSNSQSAAFRIFRPSMIPDLKMNNLASMEKSLYMKDLMNLPKEIEQILVLIQNNSATTKEMAKLLTKNINLSDLAELMKQGGKEAMNKMVMVMANASKQGITDTSQIKDTLKFINASVSVASSDNPNQILKTFMLLYLPWLPLQEGVDFDLEIESYEGESGESETTLTILISTLNYGNVKVTLVIGNSNAISIIINGSENFPKEELLKRISAEGKSHSIQTDVIFEQKATKQDKDATRQAKISMSNLMHVNPFLLLMANAIIRHTIELDNAAD